MTGFWFNGLIPIHLSLYFPLYAANSRGHLVIAHFKRIAGIPFAVDDNSSLKNGKIRKLGGFIFFKFSPLPEEMVHFDEPVFQMGWFSTTNIVNWAIKIVGAHLNHASTKGGGKLEPKNHPSKE